MLGHERDVDDADLVVPARDVEPADRLAVDLDHVEGRRVVVLPVVRVLRLELLLHERRLLLVAPVDELQLLLARRGVDAEEKVAVARLGGSQVAQTVSHARLSLARTSGNERPE